MKSQRMVRFVMVWCLLLLPAATWAQSSITGVVRDTSSGVLPGVTVTAASPALIEGSKIAVTDGQGVYRIVDLRPGPYIVTFALAGFSTVKREGIALPAEFTATINADMKVGGLEETVTVSGEAPLVDIRSSRAQVQIASDTLKSLPGTGRLATLAAVLPGAILNRETDRSAGGLSDRAQTTYSVHGGPNVQPVMNGINQEVGGINNGVYIYNQLGIQEVVIETSGGADRDTGGMQMNLIAKDGGNTFSGTATFAYVGPSLEASNINDALLARHVDPARIGSIKKFRESGFALGGPLKRDRLWFFSAAREGVTQQFIEGVYANKLSQPASLLFAPDLSQPTHTNEYIRDLSFRLTWQAAEKHKIVLANSFQPNCNCFGLLSGTALTAPESVSEHHYDPQYSPSLAWTYPATNRVLIETAGTLYFINQMDTRPPGGNDTNIPITDTGLNLTYGSTATRSIPRRQYQQRFAVSYVTGSHSFKAGLNLRQGKTGDTKFAHDLLMAGPGYTYTFRNGAPVSLTLQGVPWNFTESIREQAVYAQDQWTIQKLTLNLGVRYNNASASTPEQDLAAGFFVPERRLAPRNNVPHFQNLSPRLGAAYDLFGTGRTALKVSLGQYPDIVRAARANPANNVSKTTTRNWNDANKNYVPDCTLLNPAANGECGAWSDLTFGQLVNTAYTTDALEGFNKEMYSWQGSVSIQHQLRPSVGLNVGYFRTWYGGGSGELLGGGPGTPAGGFVVTHKLSVTPADYDQFCFTAPVDSRLPNGGQQLCGLYDIKPTAFGQINNLVAPASHYGKWTQVYNGVDATLNARFGQGGQLSGGLSVGRTVTDNCFVVDSPQQARPGFCHIARPWSAATQVKFLAVYPLPWDIQTSAIYQNSSGIPITASYVATNAEIRSSLGRDLGSCKGAATCNANVTIDLIPPNTLFEPRFQQVDLRFSRSFRLGGTARLRGNLDLNNILNASNVLAMNTRYSPPGGVWQDVVQVLSGRVLRLGAQLDF